MRRYGQHKYPSRCQRLAQCNQGLDLFGNVLQDVKHTDQFKGLSERGVAHVALHQGSLGSLLGETKAVQPKLQTHHVAARTRLAQDTENVAGTTSNFEDAISRIEIGSQLPSNSENQSISRLKPKMAILYLGQLFEERWIVSAGGVGFTRCLRRRIQLLDILELVHEAIAVLRPAARNLVIADITRA